jgi:hypothetical protein
LTEEQTTVGEPEQTIPPPGVRRTQPPERPRPSDEVGEDAAADQRTSPFPYAERFDEWIADETTPRDAAQGHEPGDTDH